MQQTSILITTLQEVVWHSCPACTYDDDTAIFRCQLPNALPQIPYLQSLLNPDELGRAQRYRQPEDRQRSILARGMLRILAGRYLNQHPAAIRFVNKINKKPALQDGLNWCVNVTHSGTMVLVAFSQAPIGVDVEKVQTDLCINEILAQSFSPDEQRYIKTSAYERDSFYQLWTRKEALLKATAKGIDDDLALVPALDGRYIIASSLIGAGGHWTVNSFRASDGYPAAVAHQFPVGNPKFYAFDCGEFSFFES